MTEPKIDFEEWRQTVIPCISSTDQALFLALRYCRALEDEIKKYGSESDIKRIRAEIRQKYHQPLKAANHAHSPSDPTP